MINKIEFLNGVPVIFGSVGPGQFFRKDGVLYQKLFAPVAELNAIQTKNGGLVAIENDESVHRLYANFI